MNPSTPWWRWLLTALAFPPAGLVSHAVAGPVDSVPAAALGGVVAGAGIGAAQWALLREQGVAPSWVPATALGLGAGLTAGAALVGYRTDLASLALMGATSGLAVGIAQSLATGARERGIAWAATTAALWALGWTITTAVGVDVEEQWVNPGAAGAVTFALLQSTVVRDFVRAKAVS
jgi:hypothetical protein